MSANGVVLHAEEMGSGPAVILLHGIAIGSLASWYFTVAPALARRRRVLLYDLRGHGLSERAPTGYDLATQSRDLLELLRHWNPGPVSLVGHSYGALIALRFAIDHPELVDKLALVEAPFPASDPQEIRAFLALPPEKMVDALPAPLQKSVRAGSRRADRLRRSLRFLADESTLLDDLSAQRGFSREELARCRGEVLCVYGDRSGCRGGGRSLAALLPRSRLVTVPGGHYLPVEAPRLLSSCLTEFLHG